MTKKKKTDKTKATPETPELTRDKTPAPSVATTEEPTKEIIEEEPEEEFIEMDATYVLMELAWEAWLNEQLKGLMYRITRTFTHHRRNEKFGTHIIFEQLETLNGGKHEEMLDQFGAFKETLFSELKQHIADKRSKS